LQDIIAMTDLTLQEAYFTAGDVTCLQRIGIPMGCPTYHAAHKEVCTPRTGLPASVPSGAQRTGSGGCQESVQVTSSCLRFCHILLHRGLVISKFLTAHLLTVLL
jgi:hypothetical protein